MSSLSSCNLKCSIVGGIKLLIYKIKSTSEVYSVVT